MKHLILIAFLLNLITLTYANDLSCKVEKVEIWCMGKYVSPEESMWYDYAMTKIKVEDYDSDLSIYNIRIHSKEKLFS